MPERMPDSASHAAAYAALREAPKPDALAELARSVLTPSDGVVLGGGDEAAVRGKAKELELGDDDGKTPLGDAIDVLARSPEDDAERMLARALGALAIATGKGGGAPHLDHVLRLAGKTPFDPSPLLDEALGDRADTLFDALAERVRALEGSGRDAALVACAVLLASKRPHAKKVIAELAAQSNDPLVRAVLQTTERSAETHLAGELVAAPRNPVLTVLLGLTGLLFIAGAMRILMRLVLAYRCPAEVAASASGVRIHTRTLLLGRTLRDREIVIGTDALARAVREVRFPRLGLYAGLFTLALGTYIGVGALVDGVRASSPSLLFWGLILVAAGIAFDLLLSSIRFGATGKCRVVLSPRKGRAFCIGNVDPKRADAALALLAQR
jgi:hypothetical protein